MSTHLNPDASVSLGLKIEPNGTFVAHTLGIALTAATTIGASVAAAAALGANQAICQADGQAVRYTIDGTTPTTTAGLLIASGGSVTLNMADAAVAKFIQVSATAKLNVLFTM